MNRRIPLWPIIVTGVAAAGFVDMWLAVTPLSYNLVYPLTLIAGWVGLGGGLWSLRIHRGLGWVVSLVNAVILALLLIPLRG